MDKLNKEEILFILRAINRSLEMGNGEEFDLGLTENKFESKFCRFSWGSPEKIETTIIMTKTTLNEDERKKAIEYGTIEK
jgi:hypothetical protein